MNRRKLTEELARRPLLCDGAMGTQLMAAGLKPGSCGELWNVDNAPAVEVIHRRYRAAGCDLITTNTFGGTITALERHALAARCDELNRAGAAVARKAAGDDGWVLGDIGPFGGFLEPLGDTTPQQLHAIFAQQAKALAAGGADGFIVETMADPNELAIAVKACKSAAKLPVIATYAFGHADGGTFRTMMGTTVADAIKAALDAGADIVGANCGTALSLDDYLKLAGQLVAAAGKTPVILQPNAGSPKQVGDKLVYVATPQDMAAIVPKLLAEGVRVIGGCCGTTPDHLKAMADAAG